MRLQSIAIRNFRRLKDVSIDFDERETVFVGPNNSGKTSATAAVRSFLGNRDFRIHDFSVDCIASFDTYQPASDNSLPSIQLDLWFELNPETVAFGRAFALATVISEDFSKIGMRCSFCADDPADLWNAYDLAYPEQEDGTRKRTLSYFLGLDGNLKKHFGLVTFSLEWKDGDVNATPLPPGEGKAILASLLRVDFVDAQRNIDDENAARSNKLSEAFATYYRRNLKQAEVADEAVEVIEQNNQNLTAHYSQHFEPLMSMIGGLGLPTDNDRAMKIVSTLNSEIALRGNTELFYVDKTSRHELPEAYNGLGFKNLVYMAIQIDNYFRQWLGTEKDRPLCQMIFIEEPEVHLHAQVQQTFIRQMWEVLTAGTPDGEVKPQLAITTHSSHILDAVDFSKIRYFRRTPIVADDASSFQGTTVHSLQKFDPEPIQDGEETISAEQSLAFLKKYLRLTHCDLFFSDAAILIEGSAEKLLLPRMIDLEVKRLNQRYLSILEVGGAYAMRFAGLLQFLEIPYLVITDIDSVDPSNNQKNCKATEVGAVTSNGTLLKFFDETEVGKLSEKTYEDCVQAEGKRFVAFQRPITVQFNGNTETFHGRTLEESFVYENLDRFTSGNLSIGIQIPEAPNEIQHEVWKRIKSSTFKKTEFALDLLAYEGDPVDCDSDAECAAGEKQTWVVPRYITEGLKWLDETLTSEKEVSE